MVMKTKSKAISVLLTLVMAGTIQGQVAFNIGSSTWGGSGTFLGSASGGQTGGGGTVAYYGAAQVGDTYSFAFQNTSTSNPATTGFDLSGTDLAAGTILNLTFTGFIAAPRYVAYTGGALTSYTYNSGTLAMTVTTVDPVASASDTAGGTLGSVFGMMIVTGGAQDFGGTVFQTNMFFQDITNLQGYTGTSFAAGLNAAGQNGVEATFNAYLPLTYMTSIGINSPEECQAKLQHDAIGGTTLSITREIFADTDTFGGNSALYSYGGVSTKDFDGSGDDGYVLATYANSSWSNADIGIQAVPEPSTYVVIMGSIALGLALWRRRNSDMVH
jgi:hypothetical protein